VGWRKALSGTPGTLRSNNSTGVTHQPRALMPQFWKVMCSVDAQRASLPASHQRTSVYRRRASTSALKTGLPVQARQSGGQRHLRTAGCMLLPALHNYRKLTKALASAVAEISGNRNRRNGYSTGDGVRPSSRPRSSRAHVKKMQRRETQRGEGGS